MFLNSYIAVVDIFLEDIYLLPFIRYNTILDNFSYNWHGNALEVYEDYELFEPITAEATISKYSKIGSSDSTEGIFTVLF